MISGARKARPSRFRRLVAGAMARELVAFVVPGPDVARARGLDLEAAGLRVAATPRHANVLAIVGELPTGLKKAAAVAYAQMPPPRAVLVAGAGDVSPLPEADVSVELKQEVMVSGVVELRRLFAEGAFGMEAAAFDVDAIRTETEYACPMHPEEVRSEPGTCPICGMDLTPRESVGADREEEEHTGHGGADHDSHKRDQHAGRGSEDHEEHGHGDMGFMSMVEMTKDLPRSSDGLQMEWIEAPFGPLFSGLPSGLSLTFTLDGDTVAKAEAETGIEGWTAAQELDGPAGSFPNRLARLDPLAPVAYRLLALRALEDAAGVVPDERTAFVRAGALERERATSHLGWLASFGCLLGYGWLYRHAAKLQLALLRLEERAQAGEVSRLRSEARRLVLRTRRTPLLRRRLEGVGKLAPDDPTLGPVARACGIASDLRTDEDVYQSLGLEPVVLDGGDAFSRLRIQLAEIEQSLDLVLCAGSISAPEPPLDPHLSGSGAAAVETPRGAATLRVTLQDGVVSLAELDTPSTKHAGLIKAVAEQQELGDALVGVASLDLSPWEMVR